MGKNLLRQLSPLALVKRLVKAEDSPTPLETIASHFKLVHGMNILHMQLDARTVRRLCSPHIQIFMPTRFKIEGVVAIMEVRELGEKPEVVFGVQLRICSCGFKRRHHAEKREADLF